MNIILDTNVLLSLALNTLKNLQQAWQSKAFTVLISDALLQELSEIIMRDKFRKYLTPEDALRFVSKIEASSYKIPIDPPYPAFDDEKDRFLLAMLEHPLSHQLITGDKKLLNLKRYAHKPILTVTDFLKGID